MSVSLRPYQGRAVQSCFDLWSQRIRDLLGIAAVGAGKTIIAVTIMKLHLKEAHKRILFLAHREELLEQTIEKLSMIDSEIVAGIEQGRNVCPRNAQVMVASISTIKNLDRITRWCPLKNVSLIVVDECHHATSPTYIEVLHEITKHNPERHLLGITATPIRMDGENLSNVFQALAFRVDMMELIDAGFLCPIRGYTVRTNTSIANVPITSGGDYDPEKLAEAIDTSARNQIIVESYLKFGEDRPAIAFVSSVEHAEHLAQEFREKNILSQAIHSKMRKEQRKDVLKRYQRGETRVLTNVGVLTEGFDAPHTACVIIGKPTRSPVVYPQSIGRGLRLHPSKKDCLIIDLVDIAAQNVITLPKIFRLPENLQLTGENIRQVQKIAQGARLYHPEVDWQVAREFTTADLRKLLEPPDFFHLAETIVPETDTALAWMPLEKNFICVVDVRANRFARVSRDDLGVWHLRYGNVHMTLGGKKQDALQLATDALLPHLTDEERGRLASHPVGDGPASDEQIRQLRDYLIPTSYMDSLRFAAATRLLQKLDFLKFVFRSRGQFQSGKYLGQYYEIVWFFDPEYIEYVRNLNRFIADRTQPIKTLQWLKRSKPDLFEGNLLPSFDTLLEMAIKKPSQYHAAVRGALEHSPEFLQMKAQFQSYRSRFIPREASRETCQTVQQN